MSAHVLLQAAVRAAIEGHGPLNEALNAVFDAPPVRGVRPYALIEDPVLTDWGTKDCDGREGRFAVLLRDRGERPERLRMLIGAVEAAVAEVPREIGEGWRIASLTFVRSRVVRERELDWMAACEWRVRMLRLG